MISAGLNIFLAVLLLAALAYGVRLDRKLKAVRDGQEAFARSVADLDVATVKARSGLDELKSAAEESVDLLGSRVNRAREAADRLEKLIDRAEKAETRAVARRPESTAVAETREAPTLARSGGLSALLEDLKAVEAPRRPAAPTARRARLDDDLFEDIGGRA